MSAPQLTHSSSSPFGQILGRMARQREYGVLALLALTVALVSVVNPAFLSTNNLRDMLVKAAPGAIVACGLTLVIVTGEIDISMGSLMGLLAAVIGVLTSTQRLGLPVGAGVAITLLLGTSVGLINGLLITYGRVPSIVMTLGMLTVLKGLTELIMGGQWIEALPAGLRYLGTGRVLGLDVCLWTTLGVIALSMTLARQTPLGRRIYAVGSSPHSAHMAGISSQRIKIFVFALTGFLTAVATLVSVPQLSVIESGIGTGFELFVVTCVVVGGTSVSGGQGSIFGSILGVLLLGTIGTVFIFLRMGEMSTYWERAVQGAFILLAVLVDHLSRRKSHGERGA